MRHLSSLDKLANKPTKTKKPKKQSMNEERDMPAPVYKKPSKSKKK